MGDNLIIGACRITKKSARTPARLQFRQENFAIRILALLVSLPNLGTILLTPDWKGLLLPRNIQERGERASS